MIFEGSPQILNQIKDIISCEVTATFGRGTPLYFPVEGCIHSEGGRSRILVPTGLCAWLTTTEVGSRLFRKEDMLRLRGSEKVQLYVERASRLEVKGLIRDYQAQAVRAALSSWLCRGIIESPTGSGKTRMCAALMACVGGAWLYLVSNKKLAQQSGREFDQVLPAMCAEAGTEVEHQAMSYSQVKGAERRTYTGLLVDETHGLPAATRLSAFWKLDAEAVFGLSATPLDRMDYKNSVTIAAIGPVIHRVDPARLESYRHLAACRVTHLVPRRNGTD